MESTDLDMDEIFDDNDIDEDVGATGVLPDLPEASQTQNEDEENAEVLERLKNLSKGAAKKVVRKPQPKLDPTRLTGERGIPILPKLFKDIKFKGKGHEAQDLATLMRQMEHWGHRLFPKMPFDEVIERVEKLGSKKEVQTCIKKIRLDMPVLDNDFVGSDQDEDDDVIRRGDEEAEKGEVKADDMWDELLREEAELTGSQMELDSSEVVGTSSEVQSSSQPIVDAEPVLGTPASQLQKEAVTPGGITPEQLERIERNKQLALERRLKKMGQVTPGSKGLSPPMSSQATGKTKTVESQSESKAGNNTKKGSDEDDNADSYIQKSDNEGKSRTIVASGEDQKEDTVKGMEKQNGEYDEEMDTEMSEVLEKGPSQNITVANIPQENAQNWHTGPASGENCGLTFSSGSAEGTDKIDEDRSLDTVDVESGTVADKGSSSEEISDVTSKQEFPKCHSTLGSADSQEMSEIIERQDVSKVILKEKPDSLNSKNISEKQKLDLEDSKSPDVTPESLNENKENTGIQKHEGRVAKETLVCVKERPEQAGDKISSDANVVDFDDELTEDQLMDTLES